MDDVESLVKKRWSNYFEPIRDIAESKAASSSVENSIDTEIWLRIIDCLEQNIVQYGIEQGDAYFILNCFVRLSQMQQILKDLKSLFIEYDVPIVLNVQSIKYTPESRMYGLHYDTVL